MSLIAAIYISKGLDVFDFCNTKGDVYAFLIWFKLVWQALTQRNLVDYFNNFITDFVFPTSLDKKRDIIINQPVNICTSLTFFGLLISMTTWHCSRFAFIPWCVSINSQKLPLPTPKTHFSRLRCRLYTFKAENTSIKSFAHWEWEET